MTEVGGKIIIGAMRLSTKAGLQQALDERLQNDQQDVACFKTFQVLHREEYKKMVVHSL